MSTLEHFIVQLEREPSLLRADGVRQRLETLDRLESFIQDGGLEGFGAGTVEANLYRRARALCGRLEAVNSELYQSMRDEIRRGVRPAALMEWAHSANAVADGGGPVGMGYDYLDDLVSGVLEFDEPDAGRVAAEREMVFYQPTPARHILSLIGLTALDASDVLVDIGCGLGHVPLLVSACTDAQCMGIELDETYVECARRCAQKLNLNRVTFIRQDAREADLSSGTVFYLYTPFTGSILDDVLGMLRREAARRPIRICTFGPCAHLIAEERWLEAMETPRADRITVFCSRGLGRGSV